MVAGFWPVGEQRVGIASSRSTTRGNSRRPRLRRTESISTAFGFPSRHALRAASPGSFLLGIRPGSGRRRRGAPRDHGDEKSRKGRAAQPDQAAGSRVVSNEPHGVGIVRSHRDREEGDSRAFGPARGPSGSGHRDRADGSAVARLLIGAVRVYQRALSPWLPGACRFYPSCSEYAAQAVHREGAWRGSIRAAHRLARCHPFGGPGGVDLP